MKEICHFFYFCVKILRKINLLKLHGARCRNSVCVICYEMPMVQDTVVCRPQGRCVCQL